MKEGTSIAGQPESPHVHINLWIDALRELLLQLMEWVTLQLTRVDKLLSNSREISIVHLRHVCRCAVRMGVYLQTAGRCVVELHEVFM